MNQLGMYIWRPGVAAGGITATTLIGLVGRSGSAAGDRPWKILGDGSITQLTAGEYPNPLTGAINGADVFFFKRVDGTIGLFCGDNATIGNTTTGHDGFLTTTALTTYSTASLAAAKAAALMSAYGTSLWNVPTQALRASSRRLYLNYCGVVSMLTTVARSADDGATFTDTAIAGGVSGQTGNVIADAAGFVCVYNTTAGAFTYLANGQMYVSFDDGATYSQVSGGVASNFVKAANNYATAVFGASIGVAWDSANSRLIIAGCNKPSPVGAGNHMIWTLPTGSLGSTWTAAKTNFVAQGVGDADACTSVTIIDSYVYVSYKRATDDAACHLYRAALSDLTTWTDVATFTSCTASIADPFKLADGKFYVVAGGSGVWTSADGAAPWTQILSSGSAFNLCKVA